MSAVCRGRGAGGNGDRPGGCGQRVGREMSPWAPSRGFAGDCLANGTFWGLCTDVKAGLCRLPPRPSSASRPGPPHLGARPARWGWLSAEHRLWRSRLGEPLVRRPPGPEAPGHPEPSSCPGLCLAPWPWPGQTGCSPTAAPGPGARAPPARPWPLLSLLLASVCFPDGADGP